MNLTRREQLEAWKAQKQQQNSKATSGTKQLASSNIKQPPTQKLKTNVPSIRKPLDKTNISTLSKRTAGSKPPPVSVNKPKTTVKLPQKHVKQVVQTVSVRSTYKSEKKVAAPARKPTAKPKHLQNQQKSTIPTHANQKSCNSIEGKKKNSVNPSKNTLTSRETIDLTRENEAFQDDDSSSLFTEERLLEEMDREMHESHEETQSNYETLLQSLPDNTPLRSRHRKSVLRSAMHQTVLFQNLPVLSLFVLPNSRYNKQ
ncbi:hypothetical protein BLNAU_18702 [Blattamonas nauphoetae]|uniref:Uncharacterized protein n=1 Tax=Blattamonas nauphoetae TaxID=2049346 RepID=A0ABQ9X3J5_9EUKA|nr:hypothetical protein BLNAU_18702 [Blattamonas nauphoetae]